MLDELVQNKQKIHLPCDPPAQTLPKFFFALSDGVQSLNRQEQVLKSRTERLP